MTARTLPARLRAWLAKATAVLAACVLAVTCSRWAGAAGSGDAFQQRPAAPVESLSGAVSWINSPPLQPQALRGKVVLLDFWTYSCINCLRTLPYIRAWADKYRAQGLVVIGVHTPEFGFEHMPDNVQRAATHLGIGFPVAVDSRRAIWQAFGTTGWPTLVFLDAQGRIRDRRVGEGGYAESERLIQKLLREAGARNVATDLVAPQGTGTQAAAGASAPASDETYLGSARSEGFRSAEGGLRAGRAYAYVPARQLALNEWTLAGTWRLDDEHAELQQAGGRIAYRFRARDVHLVLGPAMQGGAVRFRVRIDGQPPGADHGSDIDAEGLGRVDTHRLYQLVRQVKSGRDRLFEIEFLDPGASAYAFTFG